MGIWTLSVLSAQAAGLSFGLGRGVLFVDPAGRNQAPLWIDQPAAGVNFTLYGLTPATFLERYRNQQPWLESPIDVAGLPVAATWQQDYDGVDVFSRQSVSLPDAPGGLYVIEAAHPALGQARALVAVGRSVLVVKRGARGQWVAWASTLQTGDPISGMTITLLDAQAAVLASGVTDANGIVHIELSAGEPVLALGQTEAETTITGLDWQWRANNEYGYWQIPAQRDYTIYLHTERPLYRPGDTVYYNAILRANGNGGYGLPDPTTPISVTLRDSRGNLVATQVKTVDEFGALTGEFRLADEPPLGRHQLELAVGGQVQRQPFHVEDYRKPEYEVAVELPGAAAIAGDAVAVTVAADYFFGQPVANADVRLQVYREPYYWGYWDDWWPVAEDAAAPDSLIADLTGVTDAAGRWHATIQADTPAATDARFRFKATVTDARGLPVAAEQGMPVYWNSYRLAVTTGRYGYRTSESVTAQVTARSHDDRPLPGQSITVRLLRDEWPANTKTDVIPPQQVATGAAGEATVELGKLPQGWFRLVATGLDDRGRTVTAGRYLWVYGDADSDWWFASDSQLSISADRASYAPGDTATLLIQSPVQGVALLTLERAGVHEERIINLDGPMTTVEMPITADYAPNIYAKIHLFVRTAADAKDSTAEGKLLVAQTELAVPAVDRRLQVSISPDASSYGPGQPATVTVRVTNANGQPVRARVSLALVDEALFALQPDLSANLFDSFYGPRPATVLTYHSLVRESYYYRWPPTDMPDDVAEGPAPTPEVTSQRSAVRRLFLDTAYWNPALVTDADGMATVTLTLPDNLTTWRIHARAVTVASQVGETQEQLLVSQQIVARPALPRFAVVGDRFQTGLVAQNFSGASTQGEADLAAAGLVILDPGARSLTLNNAGSANADWTTVASSAGAGLVTATLQTGAGVDVVELSLPVKPFGAPDRWSTAGQASPVATATFTVPFNAVEEATRLTIHLAPSLALGLLDGLDALIAYPYGCVEQTMSRLLPATVAARAYADLGIPNPKSEELPDIMSQGVQRLYSFQHGSGGWGWFYDDDGGVYLTAYVLLGLTAVQQAGFTVDEAVLQRGFAYLDSTLGAQVDAETRAFALYAKANAGRGDLTQAQALAEQTDQMDAAGLAALALALHLYGDESGAQIVLDRLLAQVRETTVWASWPLDQNDWSWRHWQTMASTEKNTAFALRALVALRPAHPLAPKVVRWLMDHRQGAGWGGYGSANTQATAFAVLGLADYIRAAGELEPDYRYTVQLNGAEIASGQVTPLTARTPIPAITVPSPDLRVGPNEVRVERSIPGSGQLYYSVRLEQQLFFDGFTPLTSLDQGLALTRSYRLVEGQPRNDGAYNRGDLVEVTLTLSVADRLSYVLVEDPIPAGFEALNERTNRSGWGDCPWCGPVDAFHWREWGYNRKDVYADRVNFFITELWPGQRIFTYLMRATTAGVFSVLPGQAYPMYREEVWGRSASAQVTVSPDGLAVRPALAGDFDKSCEVTHFDLRQVAAAYGTLSPQRNLVDDPAITLRDVVAVSHRHGARCGADLPFPTQTDRTIHFAIHGMSIPVRIGETFDAMLTVDGAHAAGVPSDLSGLGLTVHYERSKVDLVAIRWNEALGSITPLGPQSDHRAGRVSFGAVDLPANWPSDQPLATLTFVGRGVGSPTLTVETVEAAGAGGQMLQAQATANLPVSIEGHQTFLPLIRLR
jgi:uncharacterized protein YfaS (alpha-2-macroglobulin family)